MTGSPSPAERDGDDRSPPRGGPMRSRSGARERARAPGTPLSTPPPPLKLRKADDDDDPVRPESESTNSAWLAAALLRFEQPLVSYAAKITRDVERARDVVQDAFLKLIQGNRKEIEPHLAEWLYTVVRNKALDVRRKEKRISPLADAAADRDPSDDPTPGDVLERKESAAAALRHLAKLPENQQETIRLKFQHGLSYQEISQVTGLSVSNVGFLIHVGMKALRDRMGAPPKKTAAERREEKNEKL